jgi:hypothetical protein
MNNLILSPDNARQLYDRGWELASSVIPEFTHSSQDGILQRLSAIRQFRKNNVIWAKLEGDSIIALESATRFIACLAIIPPGHHLETQPSVFSVNKHGHVPMLTILPCPITREWAGIGLCKSLSHLYDMDPNAEHRTESKQHYLEAEVRAYDCELALIERLTNGRLSAALSGLRSELRIGDAREFANAVSTNSQFSQIATRLDPLITSDPPASNSEAGLRLAVYMIALGFHVSQSCAKGGISTVEWKMRMIHAAMTSHPEHSKHLPE